MEYLAPGVYVEEVSSGNKPIEGASTSTAGAVGVTQRGPVNVPTLVTSYGEFNRVFGGLLDHRVFTEGRDALPYAAQGFFSNGGQRLYVSRVIGPDATFAETDIYAEPVAGAAASSLALRAVAGATSLQLLDDGTLAGIVAGDELLLVDDVRSEYVLADGAVADVGIQLNVPVRAAAASGDAVATQTVTPGAALTITGDMEAGGELLLDAGSITGLGAGDIIEIADTGNPGLREFVTITTDDDAAIDEDGLLFAHPQATTTVTVVTLANDAATTLSGDMAAGDSVLRLTSSAGFDVGDVVRVGGAIHTVQSMVGSLALGEALQASHGAGVSVIKQVPMLRVHARYQGQWGNQLRARVRHSSTLETAVTTLADNGDNVIILDAVFGLSAGSYLRLSSGGTVLQTVAVSSVKRSTNEVTLIAPLAVPIPAGTEAVSVEYDLIVERIENDKVVESEAFERLGMHPAHNRYGPRIVGSFNRASELASASGESELVRLSDLSLDNNGVEIAAALPNRASLLSSAVTRGLLLGDDDLANIDDTAYIGTFSDDPDTRTGIQSLENEESLSMIAVPGRTSVALQKAMVEHCEKMRYRFVVLEIPRDSSIKEATTHRQNFDTTRGAIYYPWLVGPDLFGEKGDLLRIAPAGHVMGVYARTDVTRGVWKAPANEVVHGILQFETAITKGEQDILNPIGVNAFRDFRTANRGLRVWGARTLSSDPEWKYINVRRLFIYLEQSIERGVQFAVFEPNTESLWATVKQSISNFLITVWRNGGLEGVKEEEAFFVNVGYNVTMTQTDIDNGRMIVEVGVAPVKPAEFVIIRISQKTREATA